METASKRYKVDDPIGNLLRGIRCDSILFPSRLATPVTVDLNENLEDAFRKLVNHNILAAPILGEDLTVVSILSVVDMLNIIVDFFEDIDLKHLSEKGSPIWTAIYQRLLEKRDEITHTKVTELLNKKLSEFTFIDPVFKVKYTDSVMKAVEIMVEHKAHRIVVIDDANRFVTFITQSRVVDLISTIFHAVPEVHKTLSELGMKAIAIKDVVSINQNEIVLSAFRLMKQKGVSAVAVLDNLGHVVGTISSQDIKLLQPDLIFLNFLGIKIVDYLSTLSDPEFMEKRRSNPVRNVALVQALKTLNRKVLTCSITSDSLAAVVAVMNHYKIHRIFVEDDLGKPIGVISLHEILKTIVELKKPLPVPESTE